MNPTAGYARLKRTILLRTGGLMVLVTIGIFVASSLFVIGKQRADERQQALGMAGFLVDRTTQMGLWDRPQDLIVFFSQITNAHFGYEHVVVERGGQIVFHTMPAELPHQLLSRNDPVDGSEWVALVKTEDGKAIYNAAVAVPDEDVVIHVGVARGPIAEHTTATLRSIAAGSGLVMLLGVGLSWMVARLTTTEVAAAEGALRESEERYRHLFEHSPDSIMLMRLSEHGAPVIIDCNEATCEMHGYERHEIIGQPISMLDSELDREQIPERAKRILAGDVVTFEGEHVRKDGSHFPVEVVARKVEIGGESVLQGIDRDISDRRRAEEEKQSLEAQLVQAQKMEAIGKLAGGIAHDMNNILGSILGAASLLEEELEHDARLNDHVDKIVLACHRGRDFTKNFLGYARKGAFVKETINLNRLIAETVDLLSHTFPKKIAIKTALDRDLHCIRGDRALVGQALMNLCINAVDAMEGAGRLEIACTNVVIGDSDPAAAGDLDPGMYARVTVKDSGPGMDKETRDKALEPFFTTKRDGKGTGLGLAMVHGTMVSHSGTVTIESRHGAGTEVHLLFPATTDMPCASDDNRHPSTGQVDLEGVVVLLAEDERLLRHVAMKMLTKLGCRVIEAENGRSAIQQYEVHHAEISLVILDLVMPEIDGAEAFRELKKIDPDVKVLISSGFTNDEVVEELLSHGAVGFVEKPFDLGSFKEAVAKALQT